MSINNDPLLATVLMEVIYDITFEFKAQAVSLRYYLLDRALSKYEEVRGQGVNNEEALTQIVVDLTKFVKALSGILKPGYGLIGNKLNRVTVADIFTKPKTS